MTAEEIASMGGFIPLVEQNQGLLSLLALVLALGLAFWEYRLLLHRDRFDRQEDIRVVSDILTRLIQTLDEMHASGPPFAGFELSRMASDSALAIRSIVNGRRQTARFIVGAYDAARLVDDFSRQLTGFDRQTRLPDSWRAALLAKRDDISAQLLPSKNFPKAMKPG